MDAAARKVWCQDHTVENPIRALGIQTACILVVSHAFLLALKPFGIAGPLAQILAGFLLGPSALCRIKQVREFFLQETDTQEVFQLYLLILQAVLMFWIGLEVDVFYLLRNLKMACTIALSGLIGSFIIGLVLSLVLLIHMQVPYNFRNIMILVLFLCNTSSSLVINLLSELKLSTSNSGRFTICCSIVNELTTILFFAIFSAVLSGENFGGGMLGLVLTVCGVFVVRYLIFWFNGRNENRKRLSHSETFTIFMVIALVAFPIEILKHNSMLACFVLGATFPREGRSARSLLPRLEFVVKTFIFPLYCGFMGFMVDARSLNGDVISAVIVTLFNFINRFASNFGACHYLKISGGDTILLALSMSMKGYARLVLVSRVEVSHIDRQSRRVYHMLFVPGLLDTMLAAAAVIVLRKRYARTHNSALEMQDPDSEIRVLACVYGARHVSASVWLMSALSGSNKVPISPYLMQLVEFAPKHKHLSYHERAEDESDEEDYGGNEEMDINHTVDEFTYETKIYLRQMKSVSPFSNMYEDICKEAEDLRVRIVLLPFHKHQRIDGKMEDGKEGLRITNQKVLRHAPCSVAILIKRGRDKFPLPTADGRLQHVVTLFFGGSDDREALAVSRGIVSLSNVKLTVIRFLQSSSSDWLPNPGTDDEDEVVVSCHDNNNGMDNTFPSDFHDRYVATGKVNYQEKYISSGAQTLAILREIKEMYELFIVGKGGRMPLKTGMVDWEQFPELGPLGDVLASSEFDNNSLLVVQQHKRSRNIMAD